MLGDTKKAPIQQEIKKEVEKQLKKVGRIRPYKGHNVYKISKDTLEISDPLWNDPIVAIDKYTKKQIIKKSIQVEEGFFYLSALNLKNCKKKLIKMLNITQSDLEELENKVKESKKQ